MFTGFAFFSAGSAAVIASHKARSAVFGFDLIMCISVAVDTFPSHFITVLNFAFRISGAGVAAKAITAVIGAGFRSIGFGSGGTGIGIIGVFEFAGAGNILGTGRIFVVALSAGTESGKFAIYETVGTDAGRKEQRVSGTIRAWVGNFIPFTIREGISETIAVRVKGHAFVFPVGKKINFGKSDRLWRVGCVNVNAEGSPDGNRPKQRKQN